MQIDVPLTRPGEAERLQTAVYRFFEMKRRGAEPAPVVGLTAEDGAVSGRVAFWSPEAADEFRGYWVVFRSEQPAWHGFRDV